MPSWNEVLTELNELVNQSPLDILRRKYLDELFTYTERNIICYYSGWLQKPNNHETSINDDDKNGFMAAIHGLDKNIGLDLVLHTPGGEVNATESIVDYLHKMFSDIRVIVPQIAMSAGTMIACSSNQIVMGAQSCLGPIDPQFNGIPAHGVLKEFKDACEVISTKPELIPLYQEIVGKYHPTFLGECQNAIDMSEGMVTKWLENNMFKEDEDSKQKAQGIVTVLSDHSENKSHGRHIHKEQAEEIGLNILELESDQRLQDLVLTIHHTYIHTFSNSNAIKIIENHKGQAVIKNLTQK